MVPAAVRSCLVSAAAWMSMSSHHTVDAAQRGHPAMPQPAGGIDDATAPQRPLDHHHVQSLSPEEYGEPLGVTASDIKFDVKIRFVPYSSGRDFQSVHPTAAIGKGPQRPSFGWRRYWYSPLCKRHRERQANSSNFLFCRKDPVIIWSPKYKLAYMKTPKVASTAFTYFFYQHFNDTEPINATDVPRDAFVFTFVRKPFEHKLAGFAEVDLKTIAKYESYGRDNTTTYQDVEAGFDHGYSRFRTFLDDVRLGRFQKGDARKPEHAASQISGILCGHSVGFIGHLERLTADWDQIQELANMPVEVRTTALPLVHADTSTEHERYRFDESIVMDNPLKAKVCKAYKSEFACLGYAVPPCCRAVVQH